MNGLNLKLILSVVDKMTAPVRRLRDRFVASYKAMSDSLVKFGDRLDKVGKKINEAGGFLTSRLTAPIVGLGFLSVRTAAQNEQLAISLEGVAGSAEAAQAELQRLMQWGKAKPFPIEDIVAAELALRNAGYSAKETNERMEMLGNVAAAQKKPLQEVVGSYLDMRAAGKVGASELLGMVKANVPIVKELAEQLGVTEQRVYQLANDGKISFAQVRDAMRSMSEEGGALAGKMDRYGKSMQGSWSAMTQTLSASMDKIGQKLWTQLNIGDRIQRLTQFIEGMVDAFLKLPAPVQSFIVWAAMLAALLGPIVLVIGQLTIGLGLMSMGFGKLMVAIPLMSKAMLAFGKALLFTPIGQFILLLTAFSVAGYMLVKHWSKVKAFFIDMWSAVKESFNSAIDSIMKQVDKLMAVFDRIGERLASIRNAVTDNAVTRGWNRVFGDAPAQSATPSAAAPAPVGLAPGTTQKVDAGGQITIKIDSEGRLKSADAQPNDRRMDFAVDTGLAMGGY